METRKEKLQELFPDMEMENKDDSIYLNYDLLYSSGDKDRESIQIPDNLLN